MYICMRRQPGNKEPGIQEFRNSFRQHTDEAVSKHAHSGESTYITAVRSRHSTSIIHPSYTASIPYSNTFVGQLLSYVYVQTEIVALCVCESSS